MIEFLKNVNTGDVETNHQKTIYHKTEQKNPETNKKNRDLKVKEILKKSQNKTETQMDVFHLQTRPKSKSTHEVMHKSI